MILFRNTWNKVVSEKILSASGFSSILEDAKQDGGRFANWHRVTLPELAVAMNYELFLEIAIGAWHHPYKTLFLQWTRESADLALADPRFNIQSENSRNGWKNPGIFPGNHGVVLAISTLAEAIERNSDPDSGKLVEAADEIKLWGFQLKAKEWNTYIMQGGYLRAIQLLMIAGKTDLARSALQIRRNFKYVNAHRQWLDTILSFIPPGAPFHQATDDQKLLFDSQFDVIRNPAFTTVLPKDMSDKHLGQDLMQLRLDLAIIRQRYILGQPISGNWEMIFSSISQ